MGGGGWLVPMDFQVPAFLTGVGKKEAGGESFLPMDDVAQDGQQTVVFWAKKQEILKNILPMDCVLLC